MTSQLHAFSHRYILNPKSLDLGNVVLELHKILCRLIGEDIELVCNARPGLQLIRADLGQMQQIIMNMAVYAKEAMPLGGRLTIETADIVIGNDYARGNDAIPQGSYILLTIRNTGIGMDAQRLSGLFESSSPATGTGLGLPAVYRIIRQCGGHICVDSEPGKGTRFEMYFPREENKTAGSLGSEGKENKPHGNETILVAEDESMVRALAARILRDHGYTVLEAQSGTEAPQIYVENSKWIDMVLTDVVMPQMGGKELVQKITAQNPDIKALYVSGYADSTIHRHGTLDTGIPLLHKPFSVDGLLSKMRELLDES